MSFIDLIIYDDREPDVELGRLYFVDARLAQHYINIQDMHEWWDAAVDADIKEGM